MRKKQPEEPGEDIPVWFVTYSDVITLLMTFFILLLTFATSEPESFAQMQVNVFGGRGGSGSAGELPDDAEKDSLLYRERPRASRKTIHGTEQAPQYSDPQFEQFGDGIEGLEDPLETTFQSSHQIEVPLNILLTDEDQLTLQGKQRLQMIAIQLVKSDTQLLFEVNRSQDLKRVITLALLMSKETNAPAARIGVSSTSDVGGGKVRLVMRRTSRE